MRHFINDLLILCKKPRLLFIYMMIGLAQIGVSAIAIDQMHKKHRANLQPSTPPVYVVNKVEQIKQDIREITYIPKAEM
ncbi:hypothetical protein FKG77_02580 [Shigella sonnei]|uniref:Uncharacterized protein n=2 Tax=Sulfoacidibacillus thermotolerans TaxID=1765684 RepID=A0A2U3CZ99_SULT2|nr:hypothetical protein [Shigella sonnei]PWI54338.1 hypothetical protein BM613_13720 [Sulfoacidibacillus thermotolerans]QLF80528.1 hypothetical protein SP8_0022 [Escherichia phage vB_EcoS_SP8]